MASQMPTIKWEVGLGELVMAGAFIGGIIWYFAAHDSSQTALSSQITEVKSQVAGLSGQIDGLKQTFGPFAVLVNDVATLKSQMLDAQKNIYNADVLARGVRSDVDSINRASGTQITPGRR